MLRDYEQNMTHVLSQPFSTQKFILSKSQERHILVSPFTYFVPVSVFTYLRVTDTF